MKDKLEKIKEASVGKTTEPEDTRVSGAIRDEAGESDYNLPVEGLAH